MNSSTPDVPLERAAPPLGASGIGQGRRTRLPLYLALGAVVVVVLLLTAILLTSGSGGPSGGSGPTTYQAAKSAADAAISGFRGGGWAPLFAAGIDSAISYTAPVNLSQVSGSNCSLTPTAGGSTTLTLPAFLGNRSAGLAPVWEFAYRDGAGTVAIVSVLNGGATVMGTLHGTCSTYFGLLLPIPSSVIDSSRAASAAAASARSFLQQYPNASALFGLVGGFSIYGTTIGATWEVEYSSCSFAPTSGATGAVFNATVNATSGTLLSSHLSTGVSCTSNSTILAVRDTAAPGMPMARLPTVLAARAVRP